MTAKTGTDLEDARTRARGYSFPFCGIRLLYLLAQQAHQLLQGLEGPPLAGLDVLDLALPDFRGRC
jgi:hypothetical protein